MPRETLIGKTVGAGGLVLATALMCGSLFGATVEWTPGATSLADGAVTIEYDANDQVTRLVARPGGELLTLAGTEAIPFAADGELVVGGGVLRIETPVTGAGALKAASADGAISFESMTDYFPSEEAKAIVIARNADLDNYDIAYAWSGGKKATLSYYYGEGDKKSLPYHVVREPGRLSCQIQHVSDVWAKCIFLELKQSGDDIVAWTPKARYADQKYLGSDFRVIGSTHMDVSSVANKTWGYGIDACFLGKRRALQDRVEIANVVTLVGSLSVARGLTVRADGAGALSDSAEWVTPLALDGVLQFRNPDGLLLSGAITYGIGGVLDVYADAAHAVTPAFTVKVDQAPYENATWQPIATNVDVTAFSSATAYSAGGAFVGLTDWLTFCNLSVAKNAVDFQFQMWDPNGPYIKGVVYRLRQNGLVVEGRTIATGYKTSAVQSDLGNVDIAKYNRNAVKYGLKDVTLNFAEKPGLWGLKLGGAAATADGRIEVRGVPDGRVIVEAVKDKADGLSIDVGDDAVFMHNANGGAYGSGRDGLTVSGSGEFWDNGTWSHSGERGWIVIDGGMFKVTANGAGLADEVQGLYLNFVRLMNGGRVTSKIPRSGYYASPIWEVRGTSPSYIDNGLGIVGHDTIARVTTFDVADVTGTADPDLYIDGKLYYSNAQWKNASLRKTGAGTVRTTAKDTVTSKPLQLQGGTWLLAASGLMTSANNVSFEGGALGVADGCTIALGAVTHGADVAAPISLGENAQLSISSFTPAKTGKLEVTAPASARLRIGTSACLTGTQRRHIRLNGKAVHQDSDGYVLEGGCGFLMVLR